MEVPGLDLPAAVRILDTYDSLQKTTNALIENDFNVIGQIAKQPVTQTSSGYRSILSNQGRICTRCGYMHDSFRICPAKEQLCNFAFVLIILRKCASKRIGGRQAANTLTSKISEPRRSIGSNSIASRQ